MRFDIDFGQSRFNLADPRSGRPCMSCPAGAGDDCLWTDPRDPPANTWVGHVYTNTRHAALLGHSRHRLVRGVLPGFGVAMHVADVLHSKWLGADQYFLGGVLWLLIAYIMPASIEDNLKIVVIAMQVAYGAEGVGHKDRYPNLK